MMVLGNESRSLAREDKRGATTASLDAAGVLEPPVDGKRILHARNMLGLKKKSYVRKKLDDSNSYPVIKIEFTENIYR